MQECGNGNFNEQQLVINLGEVFWALMLQVAASMPVKKLVEKL
jgi:hypothetical protein